LGLLDNFAMRVVRVVTAETRSDWMRILASAENLLVNAHRANRALGFS
jgi:hypothetical protein